MQIVLKAEYYQVKQKCKIVEFVFLFRTITRIMKKITFFFRSFRAI